MCPYWLLKATADRCMEDCDGHACSFTSVLIEILEEDLENIIIWLALNDELGTQYLSSLPYQGSFIIDKTHIKCLLTPPLITILFLRIIVVT